MSKQTRLNQQGFGIFGMLLLLLILAIIGGTGYYVYQVNKKANDTLAISSKESKSSTQKTVAKSVITTPSTTQYLVIKEWGVRMKLNANMSDAYYTFLPNETANAYLSVSSLVALAPDCAATATSIGVLFRQTVAEHQVALSNPGDGNAPGDINIGNYYYGFMSAQAGCFDTSNTAAQALYDSVQPRSGFAAAEKTLEAVPAS